MKTLYLFAPMLDRKKFKDGGYFISIKTDEKGNPLYTDLQKERVAEVDREYDKISKYPVFDIEISLSTENTAQEMCETITKAIIPMSSAESNMVVARCTIKFLDKESNTWNTHKDSIIVGFKIIPLKVEQSHAKVEYNYMVKSYVNELCYKYSTKLSAEDVMSRLTVEVD